MHCKNDRTLYEKMSGTAILAWLGTMPSGRPVALRPRLSTWFAFFHQYEKSRIMKYYIEEWRFVEEY